MATLSDENFRQLLKTSPIATLVIDPQMRILSMNQAFTKLLGYSFEDVWDIESWWPKAYPDEVYRLDVQARWASAIAAVEGTSEPTAPVSAQVRCKDGTTRFVDVSMSSGPECHLVVFTDLTSSYYRQLFLAAQLRLKELAASRCGLEELIAAITDEAKSLFGSSRVSFELSSGAGEHRDLRECHETTRIIAIADDRDTLGAVLHLEQPEAFFSKLQFELASEFVHVALELALRKQLESELRASKERERQAQKLETLGTLASGVAHDFNNILAGILAYTDVLLLRPNLESDAADTLEGICEFVDRAKQLISQITTFAKGSPDKHEVVDFREVIEEAIRLLRQTLPRNIEFQLRFDNESYISQGNASQIHQVILNLFTNAAHAIGSEGGEIRLSLSWAQDLSLETRGQLGLAPNNGYLCITVSDTGSGIEKSDLDRIFDPFFTTKERERGTGLGLSIVHGIISSHHGAIDVESELGKGTTFRIYLPSHATKKNEEQPLRAPAAPARGRVLLVDDEELIAAALKLSLELLGFEVRTAGTAREGLALFENASPPFDIVVTDFNMPQESGLSFAYALREQCPGLPIILLTGDATSLDPSPSSEEIEMEVLIKPVRAGELAASMQQLLKR